MFWQCANFDPYNYKMNMIIRSARRLLILAAFLGATVGAGAQTGTKAAEAKAAYLLAEEEFSGGKYATSLTYLDEAISKLGAANAKILYLKIMALQMLTKEDDTNLPKLKAAIDAFEKAPDFDGFNEDKQLEVMKLKLKLGKDGSLGRSVSPLESSVYAKMGITGWQVGVKLEDMQAAHPEFFAKAKKSSLGDTIEFYQIIEPDYFTVNVQKGLVTSIGKLLLVNVPDNASFFQGTNLYNDIKASLGGSPKEEVTNNSYTAKPAKYGGYSMTMKTLSWSEKNIGVSAVLSTTRTDAYKTPTTYTSYVSIGVGYAPK